MTIEDKTLQFNNSSLNRSVKSFAIYGLAIIGSAYVLYNVYSDCRNIFFKLKNLENYSKCSTSYYPLFNYKFNNDYINNIAKKYDFRNLVANR